MWGYDDDDEDDDVMLAVGVQGYFASRSNYKCRDVCGRVACGRIQNGHS
jgi:hypothetical protein